MGLLQTARADGRVLPTAAPTDCRAGSFPTLFVLGVQKGASSSLGLLLKTGEGLKEGDELVQADKWPYKRVIVSATIRGQHCCEGRRIAAGLKTTECGFAGETHYLNLCVLKRGATARMPNLPPPPSPPPPPPARI